MLLSLTASRPGSHAHCNPDAGCFAAWFCSLSAPTGLAAAASSPGGCAGHPWPRAAVTRRAQCSQPRSWGPCPAPCSRVGVSTPGSDAPCLPSLSTALTLAPHPGSTRGSPACCLHPSPAQVSPPRRIPFLQIPRSAESGDTSGDAAPQNTPSGSWPSRAAHPTGSPAQPAGAAAQLGALGTGSGLLGCAKAAKHVQKPGFWALWGAQPADGLWGRGLQLGPVASWGPPGGYQCAHPLPGSWQDFSFPTQLTQKGRWKPSRGSSMSRSPARPLGGTDLASHGWEGRGRHHTEVG